MTKPFNALDVTLQGQIESKEMAWLEPGEDIVKVITQLQSEGKNVIGFEWTGEKFGVIIG